MSDKVYVNSQNQNSTLVVNDIQTLKGVSWREIEEKGDRTNIKIFSSNRAELLEKRKSEFEKGYLTEDEYKWFINKFFKTLTSWNALYITQVVKYDMLTYEVYLTYQKSYSQLLELQNFLEELKINEEKHYIIESFTTWVEVWQNYYSSCDALDNYLLSKKQESTIIKIITQYQLNYSNTECPNWQQTDEGWLDTIPETKEKKQALWGRSKYYYSNDTFTRNHPYLIQKAVDEEEDEPIDKNLKIELTQTTQTWTARGLKVESDLRLIVNYFDMSKVSFEVDAGSGVNLEDTEEENIKKIITPAYQSEMSSSVKIKAIAKDNDTTLAEVFVYLYKKIVGSQEATYLGCFEDAPLYYLHDGYADNLVLGDWWLCKSKTGVSADSDFMFANTYELIDLSSPSLRTSWNVVTDLDKLKATISDSIAIGGYAIKNGEFESIVVSQLSKLYEETYLYGKTTIGEKESENLIVNATAIFNSLSAFGGKVYFENEVMVKKPITINSTTLMQGNLTCEDIIPIKDNLFSLGTSAKKWANVYTNNLLVNGKNIVLTLTTTATITFTGTNPISHSSLSLTQDANCSLIIFDTGLTYFRIYFENAEGKELEYVNSLSYETVKFSVSKETALAYFPNIPVATNIKAYYFTHSVSEINNGLINYASFYSSGGTEGQILPYGYKSYSGNPYWSNSNSTSSEDIYYYIRTRGFRYSSFGTLGWTYSV